MKHLKLLALALVAALAFVSCDDDDYEIVPASHNILVLNNGNWGSNDANILGFDYEENVASPLLFQAANGGKALGDLGQDILVMGDKFYIAVNGSQVVFVTDRNLHIVHEIVVNKDGTKLSPRYLCSSGSKVYVTYYEGYLGEIDIKDYSVRTIAVGNSPEGIAYANNRVYVANSGGATFPNYDKTISVVDTKSFKEIKKVNVNLNPQNIVMNADGSCLYVNSFGNYADVPALVQSVSLTDGTYTVSTLDYNDVKAICGGSNNELYVVTGSYNENWQVEGHVNVYNMNEGKPAREFPAAIANFYSISCAGDYVYVGTSDYQTNGTVYMYNRAGHCVNNFDAQGLNPLKVISL